MNKKTLKKIDALNDEAAVLNTADRLNRARSVTVGTAFGGVTEIMIRGDGKFIWAPLQPTEVVELIHQLAAGIGCHIHIQPRNDFASWREWREAPGAAPFMGAGLASPPHANHPPSLEREHLPETGLSSGQIRSQSNEQTLATEETVRRKRTKRAATPA